LPTTACFPTARVVVPTEMTETEAIRDLRRAGWPAERIARALKISRATYYRRLAEAEAQGHSGAGAGTGRRRPQLSGEG
jgi:DNA invertase Pin-like site-specific DNA recombinase